MGTWILETLLWAVVTVAVCVAIWGLYLPNILIAFRCVGSGIFVAGKQLEKLGIKKEIARKLVSFDTPDSSYVC